MRAARIPRDLDLRIDDLTDTPGYWTATVTAAGVTVQVSREFGSWMQRLGAHAESDGGARHFHRDVLPYVAAALQARVIFIERKRRLAAGTDSQ